MNITPHQKAQKYSNDMKSSNKPSIPQNPQILEPQAHQNLSKPHTPKPPRPTIIPYIHVNTPFLLQVPTSLPFHQSRLRSRKAEETLSPFHDADRYPHHLNIILSPPPLYRPSSRPDHHRLETPSPLTHHHTITALLP